MHGSTERFDERLRRLRIEKGMTAAEMATLIGVPPTTYRQWEGGRAIRGPHYPAIAEALGVSLSQLLTGAEPERGSLVSQVEVIESLLHKLRTALIASL